ncbi:MAG: type II secretion system protein GspK [Candidatus Omnitrophota bacterium]|nr:type II secretion system protein GspK [Candidatus Omnitrophota bacterium]
MRILREDKGVALILVISVLAVAGIMAVSFAFTMRLELKAATNYLEATRASYLAQSGVTYAQQILKEDARFIDSFQDKWYTLFTGSDVDNNADGQPDSKWINVYDDAGEAIGRYAVLVKDENSFLDINMAYKHNLSPLKVTEGWTPYELDLKKFISPFGFKDPDTIYEDIISFRYGPDGQPGESGIDDNQNQRILDSDGIDNNANGIIDEAGEGIDEPMEYSPVNLYGDDKAFETPFEISKIKSISKQDIQKLYPYITTYSVDRNVDAEGRLKENVNSIDAETLAILLQDAGAREPFQKAVNTIDACDDDFSQSFIPKLYNRLSAINRGDIGDWRWKGCYQSDVKDGQPFSMTWINLPEGEYYIGVFGVKDELIGDVTINGMTQNAVGHGEILRTGAVSFDNRILNLTIKNSSGSVNYFSYLELYPRLGQENFSSSEIRGVEGIRINEIMVRPVVTRVTFSSQAPGGDWTWQNGFFQNSEPKGGKTGEGEWTWKDIPDGKYYVKMFSGVADQEIGDVEISGSRSKSVMDANLFGAGKVVTVSGEKLTIRIQNNRETGPVYFKSIELSQQPDGEYVELINLTPREVNLSGWTLDGPSKEGWPATIPLGTLIGPHEHLVLCVDKDDSRSGINSNGISFISIWGKERSAALHFLRAITPNSDLLSDGSFIGGNIITLKDSMGHIVDKEEYFNAGLADYKALEKGDPSYVVDSNNNGIPDNWNLSTAEKGATPGLPNDNEGMRERIGDEIIEHYDTEVNVKSKNFSSVGEIAFVPLGAEPWKTIPLDDVAKIADRLTVFGVRLEAENRILKGSESSWKVVERAAPFTDWCESGEQDSIGTWKWEAKDGLENGYYKLRIFGEEGEAIAVSVHLADDTWTPFTPGLTPGPDGGIVFGNIEIGTEGAVSTPKGTLEIKIKNSSETGASHFDFIRLDPVNKLYGRVNINTASSIVLVALPGVDEAIANSIISNRVFGNKNGLNLGIGDLLISGALGSNDEEKKTRFKQISNLVTFHSDCYRIIATGQTLENGKVMAEKKIWVVFER